jgi:L-histidine N-alpha-methyltransferase
MSSLIKVAIHSNQFPDNVRRDLIESLRTRQVNHKFHYDSIKQTLKWLRLHQAFSASRNDADCAAAYDHSFAAAAALARNDRLHVVGIGCGGGQKDTRLLKLLRESGKAAFYTPSDVSTAMVLVAMKAATTAVPAEKCFPLVLDLATADDLESVVASPLPEPAPRLVTFFGMLPNFEPQIILPRLAGLVRSGDLLLLSANLAPGRDYSSGVQQILPQYRNDLTSDWLMTFLLDLGVETGDGELSFRIEDGPSTQALKRVAAYFQFVRPREIQIDDDRFAFSPGESVRLFFSYRHTPALVRTLLNEHGLRVLEQWIAQSEEEGVFLVVRD